MTPHLSFLELKSYEYILNNFTVHPFFGIAELSNHA